MALTTLSRFKQHLGFKDSDNQYDSKLTLFLNAASAWVESYCNRTFLQATYTELLHGNGSNLLNVRQWPVTAITELRISSSRDWSDPNGLMDSSSYGIEQDGTCVVLFDSLLPLGYNNVRMIYTAGYSTIPDDLQMACLMAGEWIYKNNNRGDSGRTSIGKQGENASLLTDLPSIVKTLLQPYKRFELPSSGLAASHI